jgi:hypothetical protein
MRWRSNKSYSTQKGVISAFQWYITSARSDRRTPAISHRNEVGTSSVATLTQPGLFRNTVVRPQDRAPESVARFRSEARGFTRLLFPINPAERLRCPLRASGQVLSKTTSTTTISQWEAQLYLLLGDVWSVQQLLYLQMAEIDNSDQNRRQSVASDNSMTQALPLFDAHKVDASKSRFPHCVVWTPIPMLT